MKMKTSVQSWVKSSVSIAVFALAACNTGNVQVVGPQGNSPSGAASGQKSGLTGGTSGDRAGENALDRIYFETISTRDGLPDVVSGFSFTTSQSAGNEDGRIDFGSVTDFQAENSYFPTTRNLGYLSSQEDLSQTLETTSNDPQTAGSIQTLYKFSQRPSALAVDPARKSLAWVQINGLVTLASLDASDNRKPVNLDLGGELARRVDFSLDGKTLLVLTHVSAFVFNITPTGAVLEKKVSGASVAALNPLGSKLVYVNAAKNTLVFTDLTNVVPDTSLPLESTALFDLSWQNSAQGSEKVFYWIKLSSGANELRFVGVSFDSSQPMHEQKLADLNLPDAITDGVVCPFEKDGFVFFGNQNANAYVIQELNENTHSNVYVQPSGYDEGFVCPKAVVQS